MIPEHIINEIDHLKSIGQFRELKSYSDGIDFFSNDYLGIVRNSYIIDNQLFIGSTGSRLISGNHIFYEILENFISQWFNKKTLVYGSGYMANVGVLSCIPTRHDTILYDSLCHTSLKDGIRLSLAKNYPFPHNNFEKLENLIKNSKGDVFVVLESVYSMDGDSPNPEILRYLVKKYGVYLIIDEAHSFGLCGEKGKGWINQNKMEEYTFIGIFPLGKAAGSMGAFVLADEFVIQYLINFSRTFIYSTALPPVLVHGIYENIKKIQNCDAERLHLKTLMKYFDNQWIYPLVISGNENCKNFANFLQNNGFWVKAILSPTVPKGKERIRIVLHSFNTEAEILKLKQIINAYIH